MRLGVGVNIHLTTGRSGLSGGSVTTPSITSPANAASGVSRTPTITSSAFAATPSDTHASSDWQIASDAGFTSIVQQSLADATNKTSWTPTTLAGLTVFYVRVRHNGTALGASAWSAGISFTTVAAFTMEAITVGYWDADNLASQTESDASAPEVGDQVYTVANLGTAGTSWGNLARSGTGPTLRADGTTTYWEYASVEALTGSRSAAAFTGDLFMICRKNSGTAGYLFSSGSATNFFVGRFQDGNASATSADSGTPTTTVNGGSSLADRNAVHDALTGAGWCIVRVASADFATWTAFGFVRAATVMDVHLAAIVPSASVAANLTDILAFLNARIAELNA